MRASKRSTKKSQPKSRTVGEVKRAGSIVSSASQTSVESTEKVELTLRTQDEATEVFVINGQFQLVDRGVGRSNTFTLDPGIYKIKLRAGSEIREEHLVLYPGSNPIEKQFPALTFISAAPLVETAKTHEYHMDSARRTSHQVHVRAGKGSFIFVFARDWTPPIRANNTPAPFRHPARGLTLMDQAGRQLAEFATQSKVDLEGDPWAGCNVQVDPGMYRLRLELATGDAIEQTLVAVEEWQTQYFVLQRSYGPEPNDRRANLPEASILMARKRGFHPGQPESQSISSEDLRLVELARLGLMHTRKVLSPQLETILLHGKCRNPMLGIFGAHLLLLKEKPDLEQFRSVINNLRMLVGQDHPDVEALALSLGPDATTHIFKFPPMLRKSWRMVVETSIKRPKLVPFGSFASQIANQIWGEEPWCLWMRPSSSAIKPSLTSIPGKRAAGESASPLQTGPEALEQAMLIPLQHFYQSALPPKRKISSRTPEQDWAQYLRTLKLKEEHYQSLVQSLGLPRANIDHLIKEYKRK